MTLERTVRATEQAAARAPEAAAVRGRLEVWTAGHPALEQAFRDANDRVAATPRPGEPPAAPVLDGPRGRVARAAGDVQRLEGALAVAEDAVGAAVLADQRVARATTERQVAEAELADWTALHHALGRDGIQACEIDAAGPELSTLATDLLAACYGPRWTLAMTTTQPLKDGSGDREVYDMLVTDADAKDPKECPVARKSGGEGVIVGEAIALALSTFAASRAGGAAGATWVRDESGSALDHAKAVAYVQMLRRALRLAGAGRALLVTHSSAALSVCDARIVVAGGRVRIE
jgi:exonuclease SbcC